MKKYEILKSVRSNKNIVIIRPDKGNGVVISDKTFYDEKILKLTDDVNKFKKVNGDPTLTTEVRLYFFKEQLKIRLSLMITLTKSFIPLVLILLLLMVFLELIIFCQTIFQIFLFVLLFLLLQLTTII